MIKLRNALLAALGLVVLNTVVVLYTTRSGHAAGSPVVVQVQGTASTEEVNNPDLQTVQFNLLPNSLTSSTNAVTFSVPAHKRLVIDYYSSQAQDLTGGAAGLVLSTTTNSENGQYIIYVNKNDTDAVNQTCHIVADPGTVVQAFAFNAGSTTHECGGLINISGHYIDD
jgi:hypothetical protein